MSDFYEVFLDLLPSLGGVGAIVFGLFGFAGRMWSNRRLEVEKAKHQKEIEEYKSKLSNETQRVQLYMEKAFHITKSRYDKEFDIYLDIWAKLTNCLNLANDLLSIQGKKNVWKEYNDALNEYNITIDKHRPFYREIFNEIFVKIIGLLKELADIYNQSDGNIPKSNQRARKEIPEGIDGMKTELEKLIREYLDGLCDI